MKIAILGYGDQGKSAYEYWDAQGNEITICDRDEQTQVPEGVKTKFGEYYLQDLSEFDLLIRTPALHPREIIKENPQSPNILEKVWSNTNEFFKVCPSKNIIGVTGTKGKGTTSSLLAEMLTASGKTVHLGGNIGIPPLEMLKNGIQPDDWVVLELANFQLIDLKNSPPVGVCLMVEPEHMDWHETFEEYISAKQQLFVHQDSENIAIYFNNNENSKNVASVSRGKKLAYFSESGAHMVNEDIVIDGALVAEKSNIKILGNHNLQNVCAAITAFWQVSQDIQAIKWTLETFSGLEHRLEYVSEINGVKFYDDSFGTTPETAVVAIEAFEQPKVVILGGSDKKADFAKLARTVKNHDVKKVLLIGTTADQIKDALSSEDFTDVIPGGSTMEEIVKTAQANAENGDVVLLSTGCASFGLFKNYKDRGDQFKQVVQELAKDAEQ